MLTERERRTLRVLCDAIVPAVPDGAADLSEAHREFFQRRGSELGLVALIEQGLAETPPHLVTQFRQVLRLMDSPVANLLLSGRLQSITAMSVPAAEAYLQSWGFSRVPLKRAAFQALKQLITFLFYAAHPPGQPNPNWPAIGFLGPPASSPEVPKGITPLNITADTHLSTEVCVIGSGAGGSVAAAVLSGAGHQVLLIERGGYYSRRDYNGDEYEMLQRIALGKGLFATDDNSFGLLAATCLGGSTVVNWCTSLRPPADVLDEWEYQHGIDGLTSEEFRTMLDSVERRLNVTTAESQHNPSNQALVDGAHALGYRVQIIPRNVRGCQECGPCAYGCIHGAKQDALVTYVQDAYDAGAKIIARCRADRILTRAGAVTGVEATAADPHTRREYHLDIRCKAVVLAGGAIWSPALLLRSGLGNALVGHGMRLHPVTAGAGLYAHPIELWAGKPQTATCTEFMRVAGTHGFVIECAPVHPGLAAMGLPWSNGAQHKQLMTRLAHAAAFIVLVRDHGAGHVRITRRGDPVVRYALDPRDAALLIRGVEETAKIHLAAGAHEVMSLHNRLVRVRRDEPHAEARFAEAVRAAGIRSNAQALFSAHLMGGLPMGADAQRAAVDPTGQVYGVRNLYVADASLFPSAPSVNPMITIMSMAQRVAQRMTAAL